MVLGVASVWNERKGLNDFIELSKLLDASKFQIVLVGLNDQQIKKISSANKNIIALKRTYCLDDLVKIYSAADYFVNPSYEETFGLTVAEAQSCGVHTIVYKDTACAEIIDLNNGSIVSRGAEEICKEIIRLSNK